MTRAISRNSFDERKQYIAVHLQQGRVILDADWNEGQDIMAKLAARLGQDAFGDGVAHDGFEISSLWPASAEDPESTDSFESGGLSTLRRFPPKPFDALDSTDGWALSAPGKLRTSRDRPYDNRPFLRLSDHTGQVQLTKTLASPIDLSAFQYAFWRFRVNQSFSGNPPGNASFFVEDVNHVRSTWRLGSVGSAGDVWTPGAAVPLELRFHILETRDLLPAYQGVPYTSPIFSVREPTPLTVQWTVSSGTLPPGLQLAVTVLPFVALVQGTPQATGTFNFTVTATSGGATVSRQFTMVVQGPPAYPPPFRTTISVTILSNSNLTDPVADLTKITKYGFDVFQAATPIVWDFGALYLGNVGMVKAAATNDFVISGPLGRRLLDHFQHRSTVLDSGPLGGTWSQLEDEVASRHGHAPRGYVDGLACAQSRDMLYSQQADPNDPPLTTPSVSAVRKDVVYLDAWLEPVTYIQDPDLREVALGGPDTATRMRVRQRVRVAEGGVLPTGNGVGRGTLATGGSYTDTANRLYLVEVDTAGDIGSATVRWSEDNASTIQPVIEAIPPGSTTVKVEDASAFQPGDLILLRKEFGDEEHQIASVLGNSITLQRPTGDQLGQFPAARDAAFKTFALADRPMVQRWNAFRVPIVADASDSTLSASITLSHGVNLQFGGHALRRGDFWTFRTRYLAGDVASGISPTSRIEVLDFAPPLGVVHHYTPLALLLRDPGMQSPQLVQLVRDQRVRGGSMIVHPAAALPNFIGPVTILNVPTTLGATIDLGRTSIGSTFVCFWSGTVNTSVANTVVRLDVTFFNNDMTDPIRSTNGLVVTGSTIIECASAGANPRSALVVVGGGPPPRIPPGTLVFPRQGEVVAAHATLTVQAGTSPSQLGRLYIIELKPQLIRLTEAARLFTTQSPIDDIFGAF